MFDISLNFLFFTCSQLGKTKNILRFLITQYLQFHYDIMFMLYSQTETIGASDQPDSTTNGDVTIGNPMYDDSFDGFEDNFM